LAENQPSNFCGCPAQKLSHVSESVCPLFTNSSTK
jgi:hypothetical protein